MSLPKKLQERIENRLPSKLINRIEGLASRQEEIYDENSSWGPFYQSSKDIASTIAAELWTEIERLRGALTEIVIKPDDGRDRRIEIKYHNPYKVASDALTESKARFGEIEKESK